MATAVHEVVQSAFYHHAELDCYECLGCTLWIEVPRWAVVAGGKERVRIKDDPLNRTRTWKRPGNTGNTD